MKILYADDDVVLAKLIAKMLRNNNWEVKVVHSGREAIDLLKSGEPFDFIISDIIMPKVDGISLLKFIRNTLRYKKTPVILISANSDHDTIVSAMELGVSGFLVKPFDESVLTKKINEVMDNAPGAVLVVDDEEIVRNLLRKVLEREGFRVETAVDGLDALEVLSKIKISIIISDIKMPQMTGTELLIEVKEHYPQIPIIMMTGVSLEFTKQEALSSGADDYITKPFKNVEIVNRIRACLIRVKRHANASI